MTVGVRISLRLAVVLTALARWRGRAERTGWGTRSPLAVLAAAEARAPRMPRYRDPALPFGYRPALPIVGRHRPGSVIPVHPAHLIPGAWRTWLAARYRPLGADPVRAWAVTA